MLELTLGMRYERFMQSDRPEFSNEVLQDYGVNSRNNLDGADLWLPRIGFRWDAGASTTVTGGFGRFAGGEPRVWISNAFQPITVFSSGNFSNIDPFSVPPALQNEVAAGTGIPIYADLADLGILNVTELGNASGAESHVLSLTLGKRFDNGFEFQVGYAYQDVETVAEGTSSQGISSWRGIVAVDRNNPQARTSPFQIKHAFKFSLGYEREFFRGLATRVDLFGQLLHEGTYTPTFDVTNFNSRFGRAGAGENPFDNNPLYIPTGPNDPAVVYADGFDRDAFLAYVDRKGFPSGIPGVNAETSTWNSIWDLRIQQELPIIQADMVAAADVAANGVNGATALTGDAPRTTCLAASDCVYRYNAFRDLQTGLISPVDSVYRIRLGIRMDF